MTAIHNFALFISVVADDIEYLEDRLKRAGVEDATLGDYGATIYLEFHRMAPSMEEAIQGATKDVTRSGVVVDGVQEFKSTALT